MALATLRQRLAIATLLIIFISSFLLFLIAQTQSQLRTTARRARLSITAIASIENATLTVESKQRGFLLTGNPTYLDSFDLAAAQIEIELNQLSLNLAPQENQQQHLARLKTAIKLKLDELRQTVKLRQSNGLKAALVVVGTGRGRSLTLAIEDYAKALRDVEETKFSEASTILLILSRYQVGLSLTILVSGAILSVSIWRSTQEELSLRQQLLQRVKKELEQAKLSAIAKHQALGFLAHDINNLLSPILSSLEILQRYPERWSPELRNKRLKDMITSSITIRDLLSDLLAISASEAGQLEIELAQEDLVELVRGAIASAGDSHQFHLAVMGETRLVQCDKSLINRAITNLISNAQKYSLPGTLVAVGITFKENSVRIEIADQGKGIPPSELSAIFQPYHRASNVGRVKGSGLGLAMVRSALVAHGGDVVVRSTGGIKVPWSEAKFKTVFELTLPR